nr:hypothetical protein [Tanacetum cinerariifolium]
MTVGNVASKQGRVRKLNRVTLNGKVIYRFSAIVKDMETVRWGDVSMMICVEGCVMKEKKEVDAGGGGHHRWWLEKDGDGGID